MSRRSSGISGCSSAALGDSQRNRIRPTCDTSRFQGSSAAAGPGGGDVEEEEFGASGVDERADEFIDGHAVDVFFVPTSPKQER